MKIAFLFLILSLLSIGEVFSQTSPVIIPNNAQDVYSDIAFVKEINAGRGTEGGFLLVPVKEECGMDAKDKCYLSASILILDKQGLEQYQLSQQYGATWKKGIEEEYKSKPASDIIKKGPLIFEEMDGGTLASWTTTLIGIGDKGDLGPMEKTNSYCIQKDYYWHAIVGYSIADLWILMPGDNDGLAKSYLTSMIARIKKY